MFPIILFFQSWKSRACMLGSGLIKNRHYCVTNPQPRAQHTNVQSWALYYSAIQTPQRGECFHVIPRDKKNSYKLWIHLLVKGVVEICQMVCFTFHTTIIYQSCRLGITETGEKHILCLFLHCPLGKHMEKSLKDKFEWMGEVTMRLTRVYFPLTLPYPTDHP